MKQVVSITRHWHSPEIQTRIESRAKGHLPGMPGDSGFIEISMDLDDYLEALAAEVGNPTMLLTIDQLKKKIKFCNKTILEKMKAESTKVIVKNPE